MATLRWSLSVTSLLMFGQAILADLFMGGVKGAFELHREMATVTGVALMVGILGTILARVFGHAPKWPIFAATALLGLMSLQAFAGFRSLVALHIPLGVAVITLTLALTVWAWRWHSPGDLEIAQGRAATRQVGGAQAVSASSR